MVYGFFFSHGTNRYAVNNYVLTNKKISVGPPFFNIVIIPLVVPLMFLMAVGPDFRWIKSQNKNIFKILILILGALVIILITLFFW